MKEDSFKRNDAHKIAEIYAEIKTARKLFRTFHCKTARTNLDSFLSFRNVKAHL